MKQLIQRLDTGETRLADVPIPRPGPREVLVATRASVISAGTERMLVEFGRSSLVQKARDNPARIEQVLDKVRADGLVSTVQAVRAKLETPIPLGYCNAGVVSATGDDSGGLAVGDRVVTNGPHAEYVRVPRTLASRIPPAVSFEAAAFTPLAAIGLQGIRLAAPTLGETVVVFGLGLIGLLTVQLLRANGCRVIGLDPLPARLELAERFGAIGVDAGEPTLVERVVSLTDDVGADAVLLTLASDSNQPIHQAANMSRKRGRLVLVGVTGLQLAREDLYRKELSFAVSCSYGPGRYDPQYEEGGVDYPLPYVRWTEQRNFDAVLQLMACGDLDPLPLVSHRFDFTEVASAYSLVSGSQPHLGIVLTYPDRGGVPTEATSHRLVRSSSRPAKSAKPSIGVIGAGNFATRTLLPELRRTGARLRAIASSGGVGAAVAGEKFGFEVVSSSAEDIIDDAEVDAVFVLTRHDSHASLALRALQAGKHVFVEKPLALREDELETLEREMDRSSGLLTVGFNRRFAPMAQQVRERTSNRVGPLSIVITVNAGHIPSEHWVHSATSGGGRIVGEACHFIDLARFLVGSSITDLSVTSARGRDGNPIDDIAHLLLSFGEGSTAAISYLSSGARSYPKERIECFTDGRVMLIDNWRRIREFGARHISLPWRGSGDKGHRAEIRAWVAAVRAGGPAPIPYYELLEVSRRSIEAARLAGSRVAPSADESAEYS